MWRSVSLLVTLALPLCVGAFVPCQPCHHKALALCPPAPVGCQLVKEPGCGCCQTCALSEGQACGVYTGTCTRGLRCLPRNGEEKPLHALLHGKGACRDETTYRPPQEPLEKEVKVQLWSRDQVGVSQRKIWALNKARGRQNQVAHQRPGNGPVPQPAQDLLETEGPCRRKLDATIMRMKTSPRVMTLSLYLPNCDKKGFYKRKQCKPSLGRRRGLCWCVDRLGVRGTDYSGAELNCKEPDNSNNNASNNKSINNQESNKQL
ncbi:insulin-like growth factor-binding protein 5 [Aplochiton taeniatus]